MVTFIKTIFFLMSVFVFFNLAHLEGAKVLSSRPFAMLAQAARLP